jgi:hypothetical protein
MIRLATISLLLASCATTMDSPAEREDVAALSGPTIYHAGSSTAHVLQTTSAGVGLEIDGGTEYGSYALAMYSGAQLSGDVTADVTITAAPGAAFSYILRGSGTGYGGKQLRLERLPGSTRLRAAGTVDCGTLASGRAVQVTLAISPAAHQFDVLIDGAPTACTNVPTTLAAPIVGFNLMDASNTGYGGVVRYESASYR